MCVRVSVSVPYCELLQPQSSMVCSDKCACHVTSGCRRDTACGMHTCRSVRTCMRQGFSELITDVYVCVCVRARGGWGWGVSCSLGVAVPPWL